MLSSPIPCIVVASCCDVCPDSLVKRIVGEDDYADNMWQIETKYYTAAVKMVTVSRGESIETKVGEEAMSRLGGLVVYYDGEFERSEEAVKGFASGLEDVDVKLLVCESCVSSDSRNMAENWCVEMGIEHLELSGEEGDEPRLKQALEAHMWPNLRQKSDEEPDDLEGLEDDFSALFGQLGAAKEQAASLSPADRLNFAEQVVLAYWKSIGGSEDELLDL